MFIYVCYVEPTEKPATPSEPQFEQPKPGRQVRDRTRPPRGGPVPSVNRNFASCVLVSHLRIFRTETICDSFIKLYRIIATVMLSLRHCQCGLP